MEALKTMVGDIQEELLAAGYKLPRWGADKKWGPETRAAFGAMVQDAARTQTALANHEHETAEHTGGIVSGA